MPRLPKPGADDGNWGEILSDYLSQSHTSDGKLNTQTVGAPQLKQNAVTSAALAPDSVTATALAPNAVTSAAIADGSIPTAKLSDLDQAITTALPTNIADTVAAEVTTQIDPKVTAAEAAKSSAQAAATRAEAVGDTNDTIMAGKIQDPASATAGVLAAAYAPQGAPLWATRVHPFDEARSLYNSAALRPALIQLSKAISGSGVFHYMGVGDSNTYGATQTPPYNEKAFTGRLRKMLDKVYASAGSGWTPTWPGQLPDSRTTYTGAWSDFRDRGFLSHTARATGTDKKISYAFTGTGFRIMYVKDATGGDFTVSIDGQIPVTVTSNAATEALAIHAITGLTVGVHTATITAPATGNATIVGIEGTASGVQKVSHVGYSGAAIGAASRDVNPADSLQTMFDMDAPNLMVLMMEINDAGNSGTSIAAYKASYRKVLSKAATAGTTILLVAGPPMQAPRIAVNPPAYTEYHKALYELADEFNVPLLDSHHRWGTWLQANKLNVMADDYHLNEAGHEDLAHALANAINVPQAAAVVDNGGTQLSKIDKPDMFRASKGLYPYKFGDLVDRVDSAIAPGEATSGQIYGSGVGTIGVIQNSLYAVSANAKAFAETGISDGEFGCTLPNVDDGTYFFLFRGVDSNNFLNISAYVGGYIICQFISGSNSNLKAVPMVKNVGDRICVRCVGTSITLYINEVEVGATTTSQFLTATKIGIQAQKQNARFTDLFAKAL